MKYIGLVALAYLLYQNYKNGQVPESNQEHRSILQNSIGDPGAMPPPSRAAMSEG